MTKKGLNLAKSAAFVAIAASLLVSQQAMADIVIRNSNDIENNNTNTATATATGGNATATGGSVNFNNGSGTCGDCSGGTSGISNGATTVNGGEASATGGSASAAATSSTKSDIDSDSKITVDKDGKKSSRSNKKVTRRLPATGSETASAFALAGLALALTAVFAKKSFRQAK